MWLFRSWVGWDRKFHLYLSGWWSRLNTSLTKLKNRTQIIVSISWFYFCYQYRHRGLSSPIFHTQGLSLEFTNQMTVLTHELPIIQEQLNHLQWLYFKTTKSRIYSLWLSSLYCVLHYTECYCCVKVCTSFFFFLVFKCSEDLKKQRTGMWSRCNFQKVSDHDCSDILVSGTTHSCIWSLHSQTICQFYFFCYQQCHLQMMPMQGFRPPLAFPLWSRQDNTDLLFKLP